MSRDITLGWPRSFGRGLTQSALGFLLGLALCGSIILVGLFHKDEPISDLTFDIWLIFGGIGAFVGWFLQFKPNPTYRENESLSGMILSLDLSLPQAYWLTGVAVNGAIAIVLAAIWGESVPPGPLLLWGWYLVLHLIVTWQAANRYKGWPIWKGLAQVYVILSWGLVIAGGWLVFKELYTRLLVMQWDAGALVELFFASGRG